MAREDEWWAGDKLPKAKINRESLKEAAHLFSYLKPYRWYFSGALIFLILVNMTMMVFPFVTGKLIDSAMHLTSSSEFF